MKINSHNSSYSSKKISSRHYFRHHGHCGLSVGTRPVGRASKSWNTLDLTSAKPIIIYGDLLWSSSTRKGSSEGLRFKATYLVSNNLAAEQFQKNKMIFYYLIQFWYLLNYKRSRVNIFFVLQGCCKRTRYKIQIFLQL